INIDGIRAASDGRNPFVLAVVLVFSTDQQLMLPAANVNQTAQLQLRDAVVPVHVPLAITSGQGLAISAQRAIFRGKTGQFALFVMTGQTQRPNVIEAMLQRGLNHVVVVIDIAVVGLAEEAATGNAAPCVVRRNDAPVE